MTIYSGMLHTPSKSMLLRKLQQELNFKIVEVEGDNMNSTVYCVFNPNGSNAPKVPYRTENEAEREAVRLANVHPGQQFYVMKAVSVSNVRTVVTTRL